MEITIFKVFVRRLRPILRPYVLAVGISATLIVLFGYPLLSVWFDRSLSDSTVAAKKLQVDLPSYNQLTNRLNNYHGTAIKQ